MAQTWTEHIPGVLWTSPLDEDTLKPKLDELGIVAKDTVVTAFAQHRYVVGQQGDGALVMLLATADDQMSLFRGRPV